MTVNIIVGRTQKDMSSLSIALTIDELLREQEINTSWIDLPDHPRSEFSLLDNALDNALLNVLVVEENQPEALSVTGDFIQYCRSVITNIPLALAYISAEKNTENNTANYLAPFLPVEALQPLHLSIDRAADTFDEKLDIQDFEIAASVEVFVRNIAAFCHSTHVPIAR